MRHPPLWILALVAVATLTSSTEGSLGPSPPVREFRSFAECTRSERSTLRPSAPTPVIPVASDVGYATDFANLDYNGDGFLDVAFVSTIWSSLAVLVHTGNPNAIAFTYAENITFPSPTDVPFSVDATDVDGDGWTDLIVGKAGFASAIVVYRNTGGSLVPSTAVNTGLQLVTWMTWADIDDDGLDDLLYVDALAFGTPDYIRWVRRTPSDLETTSTLIGPISKLAESSFNPATINHPTVTAGLLNGDSRPDLIGLSDWDVRIFMYMSTSTPAVYDGPVYLGTQLLLDPFRAVVVDYDEDGANDIVFLARTLGRGMMVSFGSLDTPGLMGEPIPAAFPPGDAGVGQFIEVFDLDNDNKLDLVLTSTGVSVKPLGPGTTPVVPPAEYASPLDGLFNPYHLHPGDFNNDGYPDFMMSTVPFVDSTESGGFVLVLQIPPPGNNTAPALLGPINLDTPSLGDFLIAFSDLTATGKPGLFFSSTFDPSVSFCIFEGLACTEPGVILPGYSNTQSLTAGDYDSDGNIDGGAGLGVQVNLGVGREQSYFVGWARSDPDRNTFAFVEGDGYLSFTALCIDISFSNIVGYAPGDPVNLDVLCINASPAFGPNATVTVFVNWNTEDPGFLTTSLPPIVISPAFPDVFFARAMSANPASDSYPDIIYLRRSGDLWLVPGLGPPVFAVTTNATLMAVPGSVRPGLALVSTVEIVDLNADGVKDVFVVYAGASGTLGAYINANGPVPAFNPMVALADSLSNLVAAAVGDMDSDGVNDIVYSLSTPVSALYWMRGSPQVLGSFQAPAAMISSTGPAPFSIVSQLTLLDVNTDGFLDVVAPDTVANSLVLFAQNSLWYDRGRVNITRVVDVARCGYTVPCIQEALLEAGRCTSDRILLPPGRYTNCIRFQPYSLTKSVFIGPLDGVPGSAIIDCTTSVIPEDRILFAISGGARVEVDGVDIRGARLTRTQAKGLSTGGAAFSVSDVNSELVLRNLVISDCVHNAPISPLRVSSTGGAVQVSNLAALTMVNVTLRNNVATAFGGAIAANDARVVSLTDVVIETNTAGLGGGGLFLGASSSNSFVTLTRVRMVNNVVTAGSGGGLYVGSTGIGSRLVVGLDKVEILSNKADQDGAGMYVESDGGGRVELDMEDSKVDLNQAGEDGGGVGAVSIDQGNVTLSVQSIVLTLQDSSISNNVAGRGGGGVRGRGRNLQMALTDVAVVGNSAAWGGAFAGTSKSSRDALPSLPLPALIASSASTGESCDPSAFSTYGISVNGTGSRVENNAAAYGGMGFVCELPLLLGSGVVQGGNRAEGRGDALFVCPIAPELDCGSPLDPCCSTTVPNSVGPWTASADGLTGSRGSPGVVLLRATRPGLPDLASALSSGDPVLGAEFSLVDAFGQSIVDPTGSLVLSVSVQQGVSPTAGSPVRLSTTTAVFLTSPVISFADVLVEAQSGVLSGADGGDGLVDVQLSVDVSQPAGFNLDLPRFAWNTTLSPCLEGRGRVDDSSVSEFVRCGVCPVNTFSDQVSIAPCTPCPIGQFALTPGSRECASCPPNTAVFQSLTGENTGGNGTTGVVGGGNGTSTATSDGGDGECECQRGFWALTPEETRTQGCSLCPTGATCAGSSSRPVAQPGFFPSASPGIFLECPNPDACLGGVPFQCKSGHTGRFCGACASGYFAIGADCFKCRGQSGPLIALFLLAAVALVVFLVWFNTRQRNVYRYAAVIIGINALQISSIYSRLELDWNPFSRAFLDAISFVNLNLDLASPECIASSSRVYFVKYFVIMLSPLLFAALFVLVGFLVATFLLPRMNKSRYDPKESHFSATEENDQILTPAAVKDACLRGFYQTLVLLYLPLTAMSWSMFACRQDAEGEWHLEAAPNNACFDDFYWSLFWLALIFAGGYGIGLPLFVGLLLRKKREELDDVLFVIRYGFLVAKFGSANWWFEIAILVRKLGVVIAVTLFAQVETRASITRAVLAICLVHLGWTKPYAREQHNWIALLCLASCAAVLWAVGIQDPLVRDVFLIAAIVLNIGAIIGGVIYDIVVLGREAREAEGEAYEAGVFGVEMASVGTTNQLGSGHSIGDATSVVVGGEVGSVGEAVVSDGGGGGTLSLESGGGSIGIDSFNSVQPHS